ncbi:MAG: ADP-ribosylglycohydrolase family protein [Phycisphaerales bacterium JB050]
MNDPSATLGFMLGTMAGDTIGLPFERLSHARVRALVGDKPLQQRLVFGRGMVSDDTEHAVMTVLAWRRSNGDADAFAKYLARYLRLWFICLPPGCGMATAKACIRLLLGVSPSRSGVHSAGNGPVMRTGVLGTLCQNEAELRSYVRIASRITHTDERAEHGALAVALAAMIARGSNGCPSKLEIYYETIAVNLPDGEMRNAIESVVASVKDKESSEEYAARTCGKTGVSGFIMHTVPVAIHLWLSERGSTENGIRRAVLLGGDTDTLAAIVGGLLGAQSPEQIPTDWLARVKDYPVTRSYIEELCTQGDPPAIPSLWWFAFQPIRNAAFLAVVLTHVVRRAFPPYR